MLTGDLPLIDRKEININNNEHSKKDLIIAFLKSIEQSWTSEVIVCPELKIINDNKR